MLTRKLLQSYGWPDGRLTELALQAAEALMRIGLKRDAVLVWLDGVCVEPTRYLGDPALAPLACECLRQRSRLSPGPKRTSHLSRSDRSKAGASAATTSMVRKLPMPSAAAVPRGSAPRSARVKMKRASSRS
jgi:hypothetical protein